MKEYSLRFDLPGLPRMQNPSGRAQHWAVMNKEANEWKSAVRLAVHGKAPSAPLKFAKLKLTRHSSVMPDPDGLVSGFKRVVDGLKLAGVIEDDSMLNIGMPHYVWEPTPRGKGFVSVEVYSCGPHYQTPVEQPELGLESMATASPVLAG